MKVLIINMPIRVQAMPNIVPTGIGILAAQLEAEGHLCNLLDLNSIRPEVMAAEVEKILHDDPVSYDLVGLSGMITTLRWQKIVAKLARKRWPDCCLVSGGGLASDFSEQLFEWIPELEVVVSGEGESLLPELVRSNKDLRGKKTALGPRVVNDLDTLPQVAWEKFDMETYLANAVWGLGASNSSWTPFKMKRSINLISSRGCPYSCHFCDRRSTGGRNYRLCSADRLMADVDEVIERFNIDFIGFVDDNFIADKARLNTFLPMIASRNISWGCHGRLNEVDESVAAALRESGCLYIGFGGESADIEVLRRMNKKNNPRDMSRAIRACHREGITPNCTWIMGYPGETRAALRRTVDFILDHDLSQKSMFVATAYPGTQFFQEVKQQIAAVYESIEQYVLDLDDATKLLENKGKILNFSAMTDDEFRECRNHVLNGELGKI